MDYFSGGYFWEDDFLENEELMEDEKKEEL